MALSTRLESYRRALRRSRLRAFPGWRSGGREFAIVACVALATVVVALRFDEAMGLYDFRADQNAGLSYLERIYGDDGVVVNRAVVEDARALMPADATYRVVVGPEIHREGRFTRALIADYLRYFLVPRRRVGSESAEWVFCYGCDVSDLGDRFEALSDGGDGILFGRMRP